MTFLSNWNGLKIARLAVSLVTAIVIFLGIFILWFNLHLLHKYRKRSFFAKRGIELLILTIIPSSIEFFILIPISLVTIGCNFDFDNVFNVNTSDNVFSIKFQILLHTVCINIWICTLFIRIWCVFVQIRKQQDSLEWKKVMSFESISIHTRYCLLCATTAL